MMDKQTEIKGQKGAGNKKRVALFSVIVCTALLLGAAVYVLSSAQKNIVLSGFSPDTEISYKILSQNKDILEQIIAKTDSGGKLTLLSPDKVSKEDQALSYDLDIKMPSADHEGNVQALNMILNLQPGLKNLSVEGSGLPEFSEILLKNGQETKISSADWAGQFFEDFNKDIVAPTKFGEPIEIALRGYNYSDDASLGEAPKIEVYYDNITGFLSYFYPFGTASGSSTGQRDQWSAALTDMFTEFSAVMVMQTGIIGTFFDAEMQMRVQRKHQELRARAHKDYHPSDQMCRIGTFVRSVAHTERNGKVTEAVLNRALLDEYMGVENSSAESGPITGIEARIDQFRRLYCDPKDYDTKLDVFCVLDPALTPVQRIQARARYNKDVDFTRTLDTRLTLDINYPDVATTTEDEVDVLALAKNLYSPDLFTDPGRDTMEKDLRAQYKSRSYAAKQSVAHNTFINIVGMKTAAPAGQAGTDPAAFDDLPTQFQVGAPNARTAPPYYRSYHNPALTEDAGWAYMKALLREFGIDDTDGDGSTDNEIDQLLGERPSYYAQMEVLTKKIYQHPNFFTNLYDKPANVKRIGAAIDAIALMHLRDRYESMLRREMIDAVLVEQGLQKHVENVNATITSEIEQPPTFREN